MPTATAAIEAMIQSGAASPNRPMATTTQPMNMGTATETAGSHASVSRG